jgi:hypothetical protein
MRQGRLALAIFVVMKPCCLITWVLFNILGVSVGWATGWLVQGMHYERYVLWIPVAYMAQLQLRFWLDVRNCRKIPTTCKRKDLVREFAVLLLATATSAYLFFNPNVMMWNMNH